jgi:hypothetical protein
LKPEIYVIGKSDDDTYEVAIDPSYLPELKARQFKLDLDYNPTQPGEGHATREVHAQWLRRAADVIRSKNHPEVEQTYRHIARLSGLYEALDRAILVYDILVSLLRPLII